jgi:hypothetical protein
MLQRRWSSGDGPSCGQERVIVGEHPAHVAGRGARTRTTISSTKAISGVSINLRAWA